MRVVHSLAENLPGRGRYPSTVIGLSAPELRQDEAMAREIAAAKKRLLETTVSAAGPDLRELYFALLARRTAALRGRFQVALAQALSHQDSSQALPAEDAFRQAAVREGIEREAFRRPDEDPALALPDGVLLAHRISVALRNLRRAVEAHQKNPTSVNPSALQRHWQTFGDAITAQAAAAEDLARTSEGRPDPPDVHAAIAHSLEIARAALQKLRAAKSADDAARIDPYEGFALSSATSIEAPSQAPNENESTAPTPRSTFKKVLSIAALTSPAWGSFLVFRK